MNETIKNDTPLSLLSPAFHEAAKIRFLKKNDYGDIKEYFPFDDLSYIQMIHIKTKRLVSLIKTSNQHEHESIEDNLLDLINYASYYYEFLKGEFNE